MTARRLAPQPYRGPAWRLVENQGPSATMRITGSVEEQERLERLLERTKPAMPAACSGYDFLLSTPFRYAPYPTGSRFRRAGQRDGVYYASETVLTAVAEIAFYRLLFYQDAPDAKRPEAAKELAAFMVLAETDRAIDLTRPPLSDESALWRHPTDYQPCQTLADQARQAGIGLIRYASARCPDGGVNLAIFDIRALRDHAPRQRQTWHLLVRDQLVQAWCECPRHRVEFKIADWAAADSRIAGAMSARRIALARVRS